MSRLLLLRSSEPVRLRGVLSQVPGVAPAAALSDVAVGADEPAAAPDKTVQLDVGFVLGGEPLIQRGRQEELSAYRALASLRTDQLLATVGTSPQGVFRYHHFMLAVAGQLVDQKGRAQLTSELPIQLRDNLRGRSEAELLFHQVLSDLHDADPAYLTASELRTEVLAAVLGKTLRRIAPDESAPGVLIALSHDEQVVVAKRGHGSLRYLSHSEPSSPSHQQTLALGTTDPDELPSALVSVPEGQALAIASRASRPTLLPL